MCRCTPEMRTPFCGKPGCEWPAPAPRRGPDGETLQPNRQELAVEVERLKRHIRTLEAIIAKAKEALASC